MENDKMYALIYLYGGTENNIPYSLCMGVSNNIEKLRSEMNEWVTKDCSVDEEDEWNDDCNYQIHLQYGNEILLQHKKNINLYCRYKIQSVDVF